jgi:hypothetical protein
MTDALKSGLLRSFAARLASPVALVAIGSVLVLVWMNTRILTLRAYQQPSKPTVPSAYAVYHGMAVALEQGRIGQLDLPLYRAHLAAGNPFAEYPKPAGPEQFVNYYALDIGYSYLVELARLSFPVLPDNPWRVLALQLSVDFASIGVVYWLFSRLSSVLGLLAAGAYVTNAVFVRLVAVPLYYYWDIPFSFAVLGGLFLALRDPQRARMPLAAAAAVLGFAVWVRASWWPLSAIFFIASATSGRLRTHLKPALVIFAVLALPLVVRSTLARGTPTLSTRATWHVALVGLGYYPNPHGLELSDESVFRLTQERHAVAPSVEDYGPHDRAAKLEYLAVVKKDPAFVVRSFAGRLSESLLGTTATSATAYIGIPNPLHRLLCLLGLVAMHRRGGSHRIVGWTAAAFFVSYVGLTSLFYFVGLAYDNVSQVSLFVMLMGLLEAIAIRVARFGYAAADAA